MIRADWRRGGPTPPRVRGRATELKKPKQVPELTVDVANYLHRRFELKQHRLRPDHLLRGHDERRGLLVGQLHALSAPGALGRLQAGHDGLGIES